MSWADRPVVVLGRRRLHQGPGHLRRQSRRALTRTGDTRDLPITLPPDPTGPRPARTTPAGASLCPKPGQHARRRPPGAWRPAGALRSAPIRSAGFVIPCRNRAVNLRPALEHPADPGGGPVCSSLHRPPGLGRSSAGPCPVAVRAQGPRRRWRRIPAPPGWRPGEPRSGRQAADSGVRVPPARCRWPSRALGIHAGGCEDDHDGGRARPGVRTGCRHGA